MSILLESLNQQNDELDQTQQALPNVHSNHYDDDMLGDESLYLELKWWKLGCIVLFLSLLMSWFYFIFLTEQQSSNAGAGAGLMVVSETQSNLKKTLESVQPTQIDQATLTTEPSDKKKQILQKQVYQPKKRAIVDESKNQNSQGVTSKPTRAISRKPSSAAIGEPLDLDSAIFKEALSDDLLALFPPITINSYVVAESEKDSFVILDGTFYSVDQSITSNMVLRSIRKGLIIVEFHSQLVKIPMN